MTYYNENDPKTAAWLRELIKEGHIAKGEVDERSITEVQPSDIAGFCQCHFFAGIGGWSIALRLAGIPDEAPVWTGSCPCQPFSNAGKREVDQDERHLWPAFRNLIAECGPAICFGEQVASKDGRIWLAGVRADLEGMGYVLGAADLCAASVGSPHKRQRLYWVSYPKCAERRTVDSARGNVWQHLLPQRKEGSGGLGGSGETSAEPIGLPNPASGGQRIIGNQDSQRSERHDDSSGEAGGLVHTALSAEERLGTFQEHLPGPSGERMVLTNGARSQQGKATAAGNGHRRPTESASSNGQWLGEPNHSGLQISQTERQCSDALTQFVPSSHWSDYDICHFTDGKIRRIEPGTFPLAHGVPERVVRLRGYGNAIVPELAAVFIQESLQAIASLK